MLAEINSKIQNQLSDSDWELIVNAISEKLSKSPILKERLSRTKSGEDKITYTDGFWLETYDSYNCDVSISIDNEAIKKVLS